MDKIVGLLNKIEDLGKLVPKLENVMDWVLKICSLAVRIGPACILFLGIIYLFLPPNEANRKAGYRTFFGMGSIGAWRFTQFVAGIIMTIAGIVLNGKAGAAVKDFSAANPEAMLEISFDLIKSQIICALVIFIFMSLITFVMFTVKGNLRFKFLHGSLLEKVLFDDHPMRLILKTFGVEDKKAAKKPKEKALSAPRKKPEFSSASNPSETEEEQVPYERQGEQKITAEDIVIEDI